MAKIRKIGILTSGGDAPGMNSAVKAVVDKAIVMGLEVVGINGGYTGLINGDFTTLTRQSVCNIVGQGGTCLYSSRCPEFKTEAGIMAAVSTCKENRIDALVCVGGDGTFRGATDMTFRGIPSVGIPGTIDNDITATDYTIGMDTAINTTVEILDKLRDTCESHARLNVVEVMGRDCGQIALYAAISSGAIAVAIPEIPFDEQATFEKIRKTRTAGKRSMLVVVSEGMRNPDGTPYAETLVERIKKETGMDTKFARLAHIIRGGRPTVKDRAIASEMGVKAVELLMEGKSNIVMCRNDGQIGPIDIAFALITDRMYKNKLRDGDLERFTSEQIDAMKARCAEKRAVLEDLMDVAMTLAKN